MLSINTNLSSLIAQNSLKDSTNILNQAIERMTTGYKINHASDNAANYSIATNMATQIGSYNVAADNVAMGMDLVTTASDTISLMQNKAERLRALCTQARNGTYGAQSLAAMNAEANAIMSEINRIYVNADYNGIKLFDLANGAVATQASEPAMTYSMRGATPAKPEAKAEYNGFISNPVTYSQTQVDNMASINDFTSGASGEYKITSADDLALLATLVNGGASTSNATFVLACDIDLTNWQNANGDWIPIGVSDHIDFFFSGTFDGNGHVVKNLRATDSFGGLFAELGNGEIRNVAVINVNISGFWYIGAVVGLVTDGTVSNCYSTGNISGASLADSGGVVGRLDGGTVTNSYSTISISGSYGIGGLIGSVENGTVTNSYATGNISAPGDSYYGDLTGAGGLVGSTKHNVTIDNCYALGNVDGVMFTGGLIGASRFNVSITNSSAAGDVTGQYCAGGLVGIGIETNISNSSAAGDVTAIESTGGLAGNIQERSEITNSFATGNVDGEMFTGGLIGASIRDVSITNSSAAGDVTGQLYAGGLAGSIEDQFEITNSFATGNVTGQQHVGGLVGDIYPYSNPVLISDSYAYGTVAGSNFAGSLIGVIANDSADISNVSIINCQTIAQACDPIGGFMDGNTLAPIEGADLTPLLAGITVLGAPAMGGGGTGGGGAQPAGAITLQIGLNGNSSSSIGFDVSFSYDLSLVGVDLASDEALNTIDDFINMLSAQETKLGAVQNRLESALESIEVNINNLTSSLSTIRDADIAEVSAQYIQQQILQQAAATLLATANQSPSIALQLI